jgi:hypothetical protein
MDIPSTPAITSFVIRIIHEGGQDSPALPPPAGQLLRGTIRNVQTNEELDFTRWEDAVTFIERFVSLAERVNQSGTMSTSGEAAQDLSAGQRD